MAIRAGAVCGGKRLPFKTENGGANEGSESGSGQMNIPSGRGKKYQTPDFIKVSQIFPFFFPPLAGDANRLIDASVAALSQRPIDALRIITTDVNTGYTDKKNSCHC